MKNLLVIIACSFAFSTCPDGFYQDSCGDCWMDYCYDYVTHDVSYDRSDNDCDGSTEIWVIPGENSSDPNFNNYCDGQCPLGYVNDDCGNCWMSFCYTFFSPGLNGDPTHSVYYDLTEEGCNALGYNYYNPGHSADPYWNSVCQFDCEGVANGTAVEDALGTCGGTCDSDTDNDGVCDLDSSANCGTGDVNSDDIINVSDIVAVVQFVIGYSELSDLELCAADLNQDDIVNVVDVVTIVNIILNPRTSGFGATESNILINGNNIYLESNGLVQGVQLELSHSDNIKIDLVDSYISESYTLNNKTIIIVATDGSSISEIATITGEYTIESSIIVSSDETIIIMSDIVVIPQGFTLEEAFPNPFNPSTNFSLIVGESGFFSLRVFNILGQEVSVLASEYLSAASTPYVYSWDAQNMSSGIYIVRAELNNKVEMQRVTLLK